jgi:hypothetical protein
MIQKTRKMYFLFAIFWGFIVHMLTRYYYDTSFLSKSYFKHLIVSWMVKPASNENQTETKPCLIITSALQTTPAWLLQVENSINKKQREKIIDAIVISSSGTTSPLRASLQAALVRRKINISRYLTAVMATQQDITQDDFTIMLNLFSNQHLDFETMLATMVIFSGSMLLALRVLILSSSKTTIKDGASVSHINELKCNVCDAEILDIYSLDQEKIYCEKCTTVYKTIDQNVAWRLNPLLI